VLTTCHKLSADRNHGVIVSISCVSTAATIDQCPVFDNAMCKEYIYVCHACGRSPMVNYIYLFIYFVYICPAIELVLMCG
jgi:hypothetical protein